MTWLVVSQNQARDLNELMMFNASTCFSSRILLFGNLWSSFNTKIQWCDTIYTREEIHHVCIFQLATTTPNTCWNPVDSTLSGLQKPFPPCLKMVREITGFPMQEIEAIAIKLSGVSPLSYCFFPSLLSTDASEKCIKYHRIATKLFAVQCLKNKNHPKVLAHVVSWQ